MPKTDAVSLLRAALAGWPRGGLLVALSGGPDSTALLHALAALPEARARGLRALHVDHGLQAASAEWAAPSAKSPKCSAKLHRGLKNSPKHLYW